MQLMDG